MSLVRNGDPTQDYFVRVAQGIVDDAFYLSVRAFSDTLSTTSSILGNRGLITLPLPTTADVVSVSSTSAADTLAGTGARVVQIRGLDSNRDYVTELIQLNGTTAVDSVTSYIRLFEAIVVSSGTDQTNQGDIDFQYGPAAGPNIDSPVRISALQSISQSGTISVPNGHIGLFGQGFLLANANKLIEFRIKGLGLGTNTISNGLTVATDSMLDFTYGIGFVFQPGTDFWIEANTTQGSGEATFNRPMLIAPQIT